MTSVKVQNDLHELLEMFNGVLGMRAEEDMFYDSEAHEELHMVMKTLMENLDGPEDSLKHEYDKEHDYLGGTEIINFAEKVCKELEEIGVLEINPEVLIVWMHVGLEAKVRMKPGVDDVKY